MAIPAALEVARDLVRFIDASPSPFHCVAEARRRLEAAGFRELREADAWKTKAGAGYFVIRGDGSLIAFRVGSKSPVESGFHVVGAHTDSPNLRLKPRPGKVKEQCLLADVDVYGGVLLATWTDRDLGLAGRVVVEEKGALVTKLVQIARPLCRVTNLAIHLNREVNDKGLVLNKHAHLAPLLSTSAPSGAPGDAVLSLVAEALGIQPGQIVGHDLCLYDVQPGTVGGANDELVFAARLDNQAMCHAATLALVEAAPAEHTAVIALFDHEEVGSGSARGADGTFLFDVLARLAEDQKDGFYRAVAKSTMISADMAHAVHPNYADLHDANHMPRLNAGPVIKTNYNQRYATDAESGALFRSLCRRCDVPFQEFVNRPDLACGSTIGPISAARLGIKTVDVGNPMLSMHSVRELCGTQDQVRMVKVFHAFLGEAPAASAPPPF